MEMLPLIQIDPAMNLTMDPSTGSVGTSLGGGVVLLSMDSINEEIAKMEVASEELVNSLNPYSMPKDAYPGREGVYLKAGLITNMVYGFVLALLLLIAIIPILGNAGVL